MICGINQIEFVNFNLNSNKKKYFLHELNRIPPLCVSNLSLISHTLIHKFYIFFTTGQYDFIQK